MTSVSGQYTTPQLLLTPPGSSGAPSAGEVGALIGDNVELSIYGSDSEDVDTLRNNETGLNGALGELGENQTLGQTYQAQLGASIATQDAFIYTAGAIITGLRSSNTSLYGNISENNAAIENLDAEIARYSGIVGVFNQVGSFVTGNGFVDVKGLEAQKADLQRQVAQDRATIMQNIAAIAAAERAKHQTEDERAKNQQLLDSLNKYLSPIQGKIESGEATLAEIAQKIQQAEAENGNEISDEEALQKAGIYADMIKNGGKAEDAQQIITSDYDKETYEKVYESMGYDEETIESKMGFYELIENYQSLGIDLDLETIASLNINQLSAITESGIIQDVLRATTGKIVSAASFSSKSEMDANTEARDGFQASFNALNDYYSANNVVDYEVEGFLALGGEIMRNISQGSIYDTSKLQNLKNVAGNLLATLQEKVRNTAGSTISTDQLFEESRVKAENAIRNARMQIGEDKENEDLDLCESEFTSLTTAYSNAKDDGEKQEIIAGMQRLTERAEKIAQDPEGSAPPDDGSSRLLLVA